MLPHTTSLKVTQRFRLMQTNEGTDIHFAKNKREEEEISFKMMQFTFQWNDVLLTHFFTLNKKEKAKTKTVKLIWAVSHRSYVWKFTKISEHMHHTLIYMGLKRIFSVITETYIKPLCPIQSLSHSTTLSLLEWTNFLGVNLKERLRKAFIQFHEAKQCTQYLNRSKLEMLHKN